ncbi:hypothetical protein WAX86_19650 [Photobacterium damselae subsp. damselae]|jgi:hypothetical protein|uniref:Uncharacterized protein n=1 Tax=Vibrio lentus TaxID=136468 RepID=A0A2N7KKH0_9VIBR|nr:hypothetical protein [Vibrio lentus]PMM76828.1 hypothetical protein BCT49_22015 [Vibrio lentus]
MKNINIFEKLQELYFCQKKVIFFYSMRHRYVTQKNDDNGELLEEYDEEILSCREKIKALEKELGLVSAENDSK